MTGIFFKSTYDVQSYYILTYRVKDKGHNCVVDVYTTGVRIDEVGDEIEAYDFDCELLCTLDIWNKYYFTEYNNDNNQLYHDLGGDSDTLRANADVLAFGLKLGIEKGEIKLY